MAQYKTAGFDGRLVRAGLTGNLNFERAAHNPGQTQALLVADTILLFPMPAFTRPTGLVLLPSAANASATVKVGYAAVDGDVAYTDDDALIVAATSIATNARVPANGVVDIPMIPKDYNIVLTLAGAGLTSATILYAYLYSVYEGPSN